MSSLARRLLGVAAVAVLAAPATALAAPPANDARTAARQIGALPAQVSGTTVDATRDATDPRSSCQPAGVNVWFRFTAPANGRVAVRLSAQGDLDAVLDVFLVERSQLRQLGCDGTDAGGLGAADFAVEAGKDYLIAVSQLTNSVPGAFSLTVVAPQAAERPPGARLAAGGADGTLDRVGNVQDAYALSMRAGRTYRLRLSGRSPERCQIGVALYPPGTTTFAERPVRRLGCDAGGYATFTPGPGEGGRYSLLLSAARTTRTLQHYHLEVAGAGRDDTSPGLFLANRATVRGSLNGSRVDALDLYRFSMARRSDLTLALATGTRGYDLLLLNDKGRQVTCRCGATGELEIRRRLAAGRYFVAVRARDRSAGGYELRRSSRVLTRTRIGTDERRVGLGRRVELRVRVRPGVSGPVSIVIQRFDPLDGWLFVRTERARARRGRAAIAFRAPTVGRWRARATYDGTIGAGTSVSGFVELLVVARRRA